MENKLLEELLNLIQSSNDDKRLKEELEKYHESDIAEVIPLLSEEEKNKLFKILDNEVLSEIVAYSDNVEEIFENISDDVAADIVENMDSDDAVDTLQELDEDEREHILSLMEEDAQEDARLILSYEDDEIGSIMTTNYIVIDKNDTIKSAMRKLIKQAEENDNITTIFVIDENNHFYGAVDLKDLICARKEDSLKDLIVENYPHVYAKYKTSEYINSIRSYSENLIPVLDNNNEIIGVITQDDIVEVVDEEMSDDYHKFAAISEDNDLSEGVFVSIKKRIPWLILLVGLGLVVSMLISNFEFIIQTLPVMVFFQSLILDMAGNSGTQSLAVTIRALSDDNITSSEKFKLIFREFRVGFINGLILGVVSFLICLLYLNLTSAVIKGNENNFTDILTASTIVGLSLVVSMSLSSLSGTIIPMLFKKIKIDPAVASGPLITTINDVVAVCCYYGLTYLLFYIIF